jgi:hypothetical protein
MVGSVMELVVVGREIRNEVSAWTVTAGASPSASVSAALVTPANRRLLPVPLDEFTPTAFIGSGSTLP